MLEPRDDFRHVLEEAPHARESLFYNLLLPDEGLLVMFYTWVDGDDRGGHLFAVAGDYDERRAFSAVDGVPAGGRDFGDWEVGALRVRHTEALRTAELAFADGDVSYRATFTALHEPFPYRYNEDGCPDFVADDRFEQSGRVTGELTIGDRRIAFDTTAHRDHSWGTRDWDSIQDWKWISAQASDGVTLNAMLLHGRGENWHCGYVSRGGTLSPIVDVRVKAAYDENWWQTGGEIVVRDADGGVTAVSAERFALFSFEAGERIVLNEAACTGTIDGVPALVHLEAGWDRTYAALQAARVRAQAALSG
jgi:hypothetical protein